MILENRIMKVQISSFGAEVRSVIKNDIEYMWQADPLYWKRTSPVLFPFIGKLMDDEYIYHDTCYHVSQHGFARDNMFELVESTETTATYLLQENQKTLEKYPFRFNLFIKYELCENQISVKWTIENTNEDVLYFQIGAHPAFNFVNGSIVDINQKTNLYKLGNKPHISDIIKDIDVSSITIDNDTFQNDALIFDNIHHVKLRDELKSVEMICEGFPFLGIWTKVKDGINAPFICLEPWHGITDFVDHDKQLVHKKNVIKLNTDESFCASYTLIFN